MSEIKNLLFSQTILTSGASGVLIQKQITSLTIRIAHFRTQKMMRPLKSKVNKVVIRSLDVKLSTNSKSILFGVNLIQKSLDVKDATQSIKFIVCVYDLAHYVADFSLTVFSK